MGTGVLVLIIDPGDEKRRDDTSHEPHEDFLTLRLVTSENLVIASTTYLQPVVANWGDLRTLVNFRLATSVTDDLDLTVSFDLRYDSEPPDATSALDTSLRTGLRYSY